MPNEIELLNLLLENRGIKKENYDKFINSSYEEGLYDPYKMLNMERAVVRIFEAIKAKEKIIIYSDYDCDGIPAAVIMSDFLNKIKYKNFTIYIPNRNDEGYGLHMEAIKEFIKNEVKLIITFDLGITAVLEVALAQANGVDVIITDHHLTQKNMPNAYAILNPKQKGCKYPDKMLCGAGIAYKLIQALIKKYGEYWNIPNGWEKWLLDMVGVATLADQVPLLDENRVFAIYGLKVLRKGRRPGLSQIFYKAGVNMAHLNEEDVTFTLAPRINAASRMEDPIIAFRALSEKNESLAKSYADKLSNINDDRKYLVAQIIKETKKILSNRENKDIIIIGNPKWRIGVLGIVAAKISEEHKKPSFVWGSDENGLLKGSCRSWGNINLVDIMSKLPENSLSGFGGHSAAGGFSVSHEQIHFLENRILEVYGEDREIEETLESFRVDTNISIDDVTNENYKVIEKLAPYGEGNPKPKFLIKEIVIHSIKEFGKEKNHLELSFLNSLNKIIKAIAFFKTKDSYNRLLTEGDRVNIIVSFEKSTFGGRTELRLRIIDII